jgi:hypothetical protein
MILLRLGIARLLDRLRGSRKPRKGHFSRLHLKTFVVPAALIILILLACQTASGFSPGRAGFQVKFKKEICPYHVIGVFVLPGEKIAIEPVGPDPSSRYVLRCDAGHPRLKDDRMWEWTAPESTGLYPLHVLSSAPADSIVMNVFVMVPYDSVEGEYLNGYRIGRYPPARKLKGIDYSPPRGFVEVTEANEDVLVAPHLRLGQFVCKQNHECTPYVVLRERLLLALEVILEKLNGAGYVCDTLHIMSGYRTPAYNMAIGNVPYSRHLWGDAADIFIDQNPCDGLIDDLNRDGEIDIGDAKVLYDFINRLSREAWYKPYRGGLSIYDNNSAHGPFLHIDVRGSRARW